MQSGTKAGMWLPPEVKEINFPCTQAPAGRDASLVKD